MTRLYSVINGKSIGKYYTLILISGTVGKYFSAALFAEAALGLRFPDFLLRHSSPAGQVKGDSFHVVPVLTDECNDQLAQRDIPLENGVIKYNIMINQICCLLNIIEKKSRRVLANNIIRTFIIHFYPE